jgi:hypothetical protein
MATQISDKELNVQEQIAMINVALNEAARSRAETDQRRIETIKTEQDQKLAIWQIVIAAFGTGAAFFGVTLAYAQYIIG